MSRKKLMWRLLVESYFANPLSLVLVLLIMAQVIVSVSLPVLLGKVIDSLTVGSFYQTYFPIIAVMFGLVVLNTLLLSLIPFMAQKLIYRYIKTCREEALAKLYRLPMLEFQNLSSGQLISRLTADMEQVATGLTMLTQSFLSGILLIVLTLIAMFSLDSLLASLVVGLSPLALLLANQIAKTSFQFHQKQADSRGRQTDFIEEVIAQTQLIQAYNAQVDYDRVMTELNQDYADSALKATFYSSLVNPSTRFVNALIYLVLIGVGGWRLLIHQISLGQLVTFLSYSNQYTKPFNDISSLLAELQNALACAERVYDLLDSPEMTETELPFSMTGTGQVVFKNVSFSYSRTRPLINHLNLQIAGGSRVAIVGPTGAGKSTLLHLLMGDYPLDNGEILIDGESVANLKSNQRQNLFGLVSQEPWLKEASVIDNIAYGCPKADISAIKKVCRQIGADFFIKQLPQGYETILTENGQELSQGQRQLLTIARLFLMSPKMILLDEATSSVDTLTEWHIQEALATLMEKRTSFIIAHRLSTIRTADMILVVVDGNVVEHGTHDQLIAQRGHYYRMQSV